MKRKMVAASLAAMMTAMLLTGCGEKEGSAPAVSGESSTSRVEVSEESREQSAVEADRADLGTIRKIVDYYNAQIPKNIPEYEVYCIHEYSDLYRGSFDWDAYGSYISLSYYTTSAWDYISIGVDQESGLAYMDIDISYDDSTGYEVHINDVDMQTIAQALADPSFIEEDDIYADDALDDHDVYTDVRIMFARLQELGDRAFAKVPGMNDATSIGLLPQVNVGEAPDTLLSKEIPFLVSEHVFENGQCTDCQMSWYDYMLQSILKIDSDSEGDRGVLYGMESEYLLDESDIIQIANRHGNGSIAYRRVLINPDQSGDQSEYYTINFNTEGRMNYSVVRQESFLTEKRGADEPDIYGSFQCTMQMETDAEHLAETLTSKEAMMDNFSYDITFFSVDGEEYEYFEDWAEEDIASYLERNNFRPVSKEELCAELAKISSRMMKAIDKSLLELGTSLADAGIHMDQFQ